MKDGFALLSPYGPKVTRQDEGADREEASRHHLREVLRVPGPALRPERQAPRAEGQADDAAADPLDRLARQGNRGQPEGLDAVRLRRRSGHAHAHGQPPRSARPLSAGRPCRCAGSRSGSPASSRTTASTSRPRRARCTRCSARTAPARARSRTSSPGSTGPTRASSQLYGAPGRVPLAARRARRGDRHGAPALPARRAVHRRRERRPRRPPRRRPLVPPPPGEIEQRVAELGERYGLAVDPRARIWQLSVGEQQRVEILKALYREARILILDEPTAVLTPQEAEALFVTLRAMAAEGRTVIFISHKLHEVIGGRRPRHGAPRRPVDRDGRHRRRDAAVARRADGRPRGRRRAAREGRHARRGRASSSTGLGRRRPRRRRAPRRLARRPRRRGPRRRRRGRQRPARARRGDHRPARRSSPGTVSRRRARRCTAATRGGDHGRASRTCRRTGCTPVSRRASASPRTSCSSRIAAGGLGRARCCGCAGSATARSS